MSRSAIFPSPQVESVPVREGVLRVANPPPLSGGETLPAMHIAWRLSGQLGAPVVGVLGGISADRHVDTAADGSAGWWGSVVGPGAWVDTRCYQVLSIDYLAGIGDSSAPNDQDPEFPLIDTRDQAEALASVMAHLDIRGLHALVGLSYGGQVGLQFACAFSDRLRHLIVYGAAARADSRARAQRSIQRRILQAGLDQGAGSVSVAIARELAILGYCGEADQRRWFSPTPEVDGHQLRHATAGDLYQQSAVFAARCNAMRYLRLCQSCDLHSVDPAALAVPTTLIACRQDRVAGLQGMRDLARDCDAVLHQFDSAAGHDAFLREPDRLGALLRSVLAEVDR